MYFSGAKLENLINEAAILGKRNSGSIEANDIDMAFISLWLAWKRRTEALFMILTGNNCIHEAGHALVTKIIAPENRVSRVTIIPSTKGAGGFSLSIPPDRMYFKKAI